MEFQKTINLPEIILNDKKSSKLQKKKLKKYSINKKIKIERPIIVLSMKHNSII